MGSPRVAVALTIAGSDPSGGAGIQADLKTFHQFHAYGEAVITLVTVQNTTTVSHVELLAPSLVAAQISAVLSDIPPQAIKTGALGSAEMIDTVAGSLRGCPAQLVVDPVMISKHGMPLIADDARGALARVLLPMAFLVTPNLHEAEALTHRSVRTLSDMAAAARAISDLGPKAVLIKGGHLEGEAVDLLWMAGEQYTFPAQRVPTQHTHGTGCTYSAAITALLAHGQPLPAAVETAKRFITNAIASAPGLGAGHGPVNHFADEFRGERSTRASDK